MLRRSARTPLYALALASMVLALFAAPALAHKEGTGGKKALGTVASFDGTTLTVTMTDGSSFTGAVSDTVQIKVEHRGHKEHGKGHKKPSNGSVADLTAGAMVLRMKVTCDEVTKLRVRRAPVVAAPMVEAAPVVEADPTVTTASTEDAGDVETEEVEPEEVETEEVATEDAEETDDDGCSEDTDDVEEVETEDATETVEVEEEATV